MSKKIKAVVASLLLTVVISTTAVAAPISTTKTFGGNEVVMQPDGTEIEYDKDYLGNVYYNLPIVTKKVTQGNGGNTLKFCVNVVDKHVMIESDKAYLEVNNVQKEGDNNGKRVVYTKGKTTLNFKCSEDVQCKSVSKYSRYLLNNGNIVYSEHSNTENVIADGNDQSIEIVEPGLYHVDFSNGTLRGLGFDLYVSADGSDLVTKETSNIAVPKTVDINVDGTHTQVPVYDIDGSVFTRVRDIAYILNNSHKSVAVVYNPGTNTTGVNITRSLLGNPVYTTVGGELEQLPSDSKTLAQSSGHIALNGSTKNLQIYSIDGKDFVNIKALT